MGSETTVHATAIVEPLASIGAGTMIWHHAHVRDGAVIGEGCRLGKNVFVDAGVAVGDRVKIQNDVSVFRGVTIADDVFLGPSCVFTNDRVPRSSQADWELAPTDVRRGASIGANATVVAGVTIGDWAMIGAGAVVTGDVDAHQLVIGNPARPAGWVCTCGRVASRDPRRPAGEIVCDQCLGGPP